MLVHEFIRPPMGLNWGMRLHRYADGHCAFIIYDNGRGTQCEVVLSQNETLELQKVLACQDEYLRDV